MADLTAVVRATRASARAIDAIARISREIRDYERRGDTRSAALLYPKLCAAQRRYHAAQLVLAVNPLPGDKA